MPHNDWAQIELLFNTLVDLTVEERRLLLYSPAPPVSPVLHRLKGLLDAHDREERRVGRVVDRAFVGASVRAAKDRRP